MSWFKENPEALRARMVEKQLRDRGIRDPEVLRVMGEVPRDHFVPAGQRSGAYRDQALPLTEGQTISQPYMVAVMTEALGLTGKSRVLEIGTGSGYQAAVLARLAGEVYTVERIPRLLEGARRSLGALGVENVRFRLGDGTLGWPEEGPYEGILVTAGAPGLPGSLLDQLAPRGGRLVIPVGDRSVQELVRVVREGERYRRKELLSCRFVPLLGQEGWKTPGS